VVVAVAAVVEHPVEDHLVAQEGVETNA
jgi:hypothetical protein